MVGEHAGVGDGGGGGAGAALTPACVTVVRWFPIRMLPARCSPPFAATVKFTVPFPLPLSGPVSVIQITSAVAVHAQSASVPTFTLLAPPPALMLRLEGPTSKRQGARWDTRACSPLTTIIASREDDPSLGETRNAMLTVPCPDAGEKPEIQFALVAAFQAHSGCVVIASAFIPPPASTMTGDASDTWHFTGSGLALTVEEVSQPATAAAATTRRSIAACFTAGLNSTAAREQEPFQRFPDPNH